MRQTVLVTSSAWLFTSVLLAGDAVDYRRDIRPLLKERCYACHGVLKQQSGLRLDSGALILKGGESGPAVEPGDPAESLLIQRVSAADPSERMPPEGKPLDKQQIDRLKAWIAAGAKTPSNDKPEEDPLAHWAFRRPARPPVPQIADNSWGRTPIDALIAAEHQRRSLRPAPAASKHVLLRRVYLDLIGLPPTREQLQAFLSDSSPRAYERVVEQLLSSPQYGERWARHWMDVWRYSDWYGRRESNDVRNSYPHIWRWRDWIVRSLNEDKPYDQMVVEMLAADEVAPANDDTVVATGFIARNWFSLNYNIWMKDLVEHTGKAFLGLTLNCAMCHDHKYDPITQEEYFKFRAFFEPLELRQDRVAGLPDPGPFKKYVYPLSTDPIKAGLVRVFDEKLDAQTYMFQGGDERSRFEGRPPVAPGAPAFLAGDKLRVEPVELPPVAFYPGLKNFLQREELAKWDSEMTPARAQVAQWEQRVAAAAAQLAIAELRTKGPPAEPPKLALADAAKLPSEPVAGIPQPVAGETVSPAGANKSQPAGKRTSKGLSAADSILSPLQEARRLVEDAKMELKIRQSHLANVATQQAAIRSRVAADNARFRGQGGNVAELIKAASQLDRPAAIRAAEEQVALAEKEVLKGRRLYEANPTVFGPLKRAEEALVKANAALEASRKGTQAAEHGYTPLSPTYPRRSTGRRTALARWIASRDNPLTARVAVNYIWMHHFGRPLVESTFDFGRNGKKPTNPRLLDWLAVELIDNRWSMKSLHRSIVTSEVYRMQSGAAARDADRSNQSIDRDNRWLWRFNPRRMDAEVVRDSILHVAGELDAALGGQEIDYSQGLTSRRRSLYLSHHAEGKMELLELFDAANACDCYKRMDTVRPQQALAMTNSELVLNQSRLLARKLWDRLQTASSKASAGESEFIEAAFEQLLARAPSAAEKNLSLRFLDKQAAMLSGALPGKAEPSKSPAAGLVGPSRDPRMRARESLVRALFSHNDFLTIH